MGYTATAMPRLFQLLVQLPKVENTGQGSGTMSSTVSQLNKESEQIWTQLEAH
jgi:hypothetical protein